MMFLTLLALLVLLVNLYVLLDIVSGVKQLRALDEIAPQNLESSPMVSVVVPACNEEEAIDPALRSLLALGYDNIEILVVDDRSTDNTAGVLRNIQKEHPRLQILTISELPEGWLGKNNALHRGALRAKGEYILFTDADILFAPSTLKRAVSLMVSEKLDHLSLIFKNVAKGALLGAMMMDAGGGLFFLFKPWKVNDPKSKHFIGVGAFNLVRKSVYHKIEGHKSIRMHPIDDILLGKIIKQNGFTQDCLTAYNFLTVHWYSSPRKMINGLMKNIFALYDYKIFYAMIAVILIFALTILPLWGALLGAGMFRGVCLTIVCVRLSSTVYGIRSTGMAWKTLPFSFITPYVNIYIIVKGVIKTIAGKGIEWRGTHYPLDKLKKSISIFDDVMRGL